MIRSARIKILSFALILLFVAPFSVDAVVVEFNVESNYDIFSRSSLEAILQRSTTKTDIYVEERWWDSLDLDRQLEIDKRIYQLGKEFDNRIYPEMQSLFDYNLHHPVDDSGKLTILFHEMFSESGGYFNSGDQYSRYQYNRSNESNIVYINARFADKDYLDGFLAHEFMHLITFDKKEREYNTREEIWLNEARAEYMPTFFDYDDGNLSRRRRSFISYPDNSITEWLNRSADYGSVNIFVQYLVDHYGIEILVDSLKSSKVGIRSINEALEKNNYSEDFSQIFTDWTIAVLLNDCSINSRYCFNSKELEDLRIVPMTSYLSREYGSSSASRRVTKDWAGNWYRVVGGVGDLRMEFKSNRQDNFRVPYVLCDLSDSCKINFINLDNYGDGEIKIANFQENYSSLTIIPSAQGKISEFNGEESPVYFDWIIETGERERPPQEDELMIQELLAKIEELKQELARLQRELGISQPPILCRVDNNLYFGLRNDEVKCLQEFLKKEGVYPEKLITGNFFNLTRQAVVRFQNKYASEILHPIGLSQGTGYVGPRTRDKINKILELDQMISS